MMPATKLDVKRTLMQVVIVKPNPFGSGQQEMVFTFLFLIIYFLF